MKFLFLMDPLETVVFEKDTALYSALLAKHQLRPEQTWMIGNSPRSDINPAKAAEVRPARVDATTRAAKVEAFRP